MPECEDSVHGQGLCKKHHQRWLRHGNPYVERKARCEVCLKAARIFRRPSHTASDDLEKYADLYLLYRTGSPYRLTTLDEDGREYDLEEGLTYAR
jgi:hypothetical protein